MNHQEYEYPEFLYSVGHHLVTQWRYATDIEIVEWKIKTNTAASFN
jgi:hypothetical protein